MTRSIALILFLGLPTFTLAQYENIHKIPLPDEFSSAANAVEIYSTPNPNFAEYADEKKEEIVWKHSTIIKASEEMTITETGAFLLYNGTWQKRASFNKGQIKNMFATKTLDLKEGDSIVFKENWRYANLTETGWNFWYVKAKNKKGEELYGIDILETKGELADGTKILGLSSDSSIINWTGKAGDSDYSLSGTIAEFDGKITVQKGILKDCSITIKTNSITHEMEALIGHLKSADFFDTETYPKAEFKTNSIQMLSDTTCQLKGDFTLRGITKEETINVKLQTTDKAYLMQYNLDIDRTKYGANYASSKAPNENYKISDHFKLHGILYFQKDYPGSAPWNNVHPKK
jgi:polyisoprenoid-binding protein YceI